MGKSSFLILGGSGFIGRNFVSFLVNNKHASTIRIVDKVPPQVAWLNKVHTKCFNDPVVEFQSANLINPDSCKNAFALPEEGRTWDYVINCAGETKPGQTDPVYKEGILKLSLNCASAAAAYNVKRYIELSVGNMSSAEKIPHREDDPVDPWTFIAKWKRKVEEEIASIPNLRYTILRPAVVYGLGDRSGLMPRIMVAAIYKYLDETMKLLWDKDMKFNTVHVDDLCSAILFVCEKEETVKQIYNVVDDSNMTQGKISDLLSLLFSIKVEYYGNLVSTVVDLTGAADDANDKHLEPWAAACRTDNILNTPLSPHMDPELLLHKHLNLDGEKLKRAGFKLSVPSPTVENLKQIVNDFVDMKVYPSSLIP